MPFNDLINSLGQKYKDNLDQLTQVRDASGSQTADRIRMADQSLQGPRMDDTPTPEENAYAQNTAAAMMGSVAPAGTIEGLAGRMAEMTPAESAAAKLANGAVESGAEMPVVQEGQQALSRAADFADRARQQRFQRLQDTIKRARGM